MNGYTLCTSLGNNKPASQPCVEVKRRTWYRIIIAKRIKRGKGSRKEVIVKGRAETREHVSHSTFTNVCALRASPAPTSQAARTKDNGRQ